MSFYASSVSYDAGEGSGSLAVASPGQGLRLMGFTSLETLGGTALFYLHNGTGSGDPVSFLAALGSGESRSEWFGEGGILSEAGIWLERASGTTRVVVHFKRAA